MKDYQRCDWKTDSHVWVWSSTDPNDSDPHPQAKCLCGLFTWKEYTERYTQKIELPQSRLDILNYD